MKRFRTGFPVPLLLHSTALRTGLKGTVTEGVHKCATLISNKAIAEILNVLDEKEEEMQLRN
jgi:hypothetical protein